MPLKHICIVDDDMDDIFLMSACLKRLEDEAALKLTISTFTDGRDALSYFSTTRVPDALLPDCMCLDINMPGMDGIELLTRLREMRHLDRLPIYIVSTTIDRKTHEKAISLGANGSYSKPETMAAMEEMQKQLLGIRTGE
ncbi:response regulator [Hoeflea olei]|uniref:Response regulatory domain-containing protein n=1 Tax=Hoeflea olei TaxID=1480615 RepID=A0A1C1YW34_9HYPH|nr:response regulator [Hoeflea olei]OCW57763.1 hypothetical protein AWJ14_02880 [Hoeflea olei]